MSRIRPRSVFDVLALLSFFLVLGGGTALASYVVSSNSQVGPATISGSKPPSGKHANIITNSITGKDIADRSGVDTCPSPLTVKLGPICAGSDGGARNWASAVQYCADFDLRLPSLAEAVALASNHAVPGVTTDQQFWTDNEFVDGNSFDATIVSTHGGASHVIHDHESATHQTVCVTDPSA